MLTLVRRSFGRIARLFLAAALLLAGFQLALIGAAASLQASGDFERLADAVPAFVRDGLGPALLSFAGMTSLAFFEPLVVLLIVLFAIAVATEPAGDVESGLVDLILARPLPRHWLMTRSLLLMTGVIVGLVGFLGLSMWIGLWLLAPAGVAWPAPSKVLELMAHLAAIAWLFGCVGLAAAATVTRRSSALGIVSLSAVGLYLLNVLVEFSDTFKPIWWMTPFQFFHGSAILYDVARPALDLSVLLGIGVVFAASAYWRFEKRDL
jgi:ABC-2 type transport system permease protein